MKKIVNHSTKDKILKIAEKHFASRGYEGVSLSLLAEEVGISKPALYYYFDSKEKLYFEIILRAINNLKEKMGKSFNAGLTLEENIRLVLSNYINLIFENRNIILLMKHKMCLTNPEMTDNIRRVVKEVQDILRPLIEKVIQYRDKEGKIEPDIAARMLFGAINALVGEELINPEQAKIDTDKIVDYFVFILLDK